jgi:pimeloyl-ACP methyl ester carboxylesterase
MLASAQLPGECYQPRARSVALTGATLRIAEAGSGQPLLLVNGLGAGFGTWWPFARRLSQSRRLIMFDALYAISWWTSLHWLHRVTTPTLVFCGTQDPLVPVQNAHLLARRIPRARLELIPRGGHLWMLEHPEASAALVDEFLSG